MMNITPGKPPPGIDHNLYRNKKIGGGTWILSRIFGAGVRIIRRVIWMIPFPDRERSEA
jgi:hypothetical protein